MVQVFEAFSNLLGDLLLVAAASTSGATSQEKFKVLPCRVKIQGLSLIGCAWQ
jgi:hypothetical protein